MSPTPKGYATAGEEVVALLREVGLRRLMGSDGCNCGWVHLRGFHIDRSCHKSQSSLRVYLQGDGFGADHADLELVAREALRQMREEDGWSDIIVRYCESDYPTKDALKGKCTYCGKPRAHPESYLCETCLTGNDAWGQPIAPQFAFHLLTPHGVQPGKKDAP